MSEFFKDDQNCTSPAKDEFVYIGEIGFKVLWTIATTYLMEHKKFLSFNNVING